MDTYIMLKSFSNF